MREILTSGSVQPIKLLIREVKVLSVQVPNRHCSDTQQWMEAIPPLEAWK
jgi:hypothetical protein